MAEFIAHWLSDALRLGLPLAFAIAAMQVPALTHDYAAALLQVAKDGQRDIDQREASARQFYHLKADTDEVLIKALQPLEPSNAQTLAMSVERTRTLRAAYNRIQAAPPLLQPVAAVADMITDAKGYRRTVLRTAFNIFTPEVVISTASAAYGLAGLVVGSFIAQVVISLFGSFARLARPKRRNAASSFY
ncbi:MAG TPA: DUF2937 family protein [Dehalococcoidia bacterium]|nr:DUF2937 family protein [Dehalococcoidia bacterium]